MGIVRSVAEGRVWLALRRLVAGDLTGRDWWDKQLFGVGATWRCRVGDICVSWNANPGYSLEHYDALLHLVQPMGQPQILNLKNEALNKQL